MGNYLTYSATVNDLEPYLPVVALDSLLSDVSNDTDRIAAVNEAIDAAESEVDSYVGKLYTVPLTSPTAFIIGIAADLTVERLYQRGTGIPQDVKDRASTARRNLRDLSSGTAVIAGATIPTPPTTNGVAMQDSEPRVMVRDDLNWF